MTLIEIKTIRIIKYRETGVKNSLAIKKNKYKDIFYY